MRGLPRMVGHPCRAACAERRPAARFRAAFRTAPISSASGVRSAGSLAGKRADCALPDGPNELRELLDRSPPASPLGPDHDKAGHRRRRKTRGGHDDRIRGSQPQDSHGDHDQPGKTHQEHLGRMTGAPGTSPTVMDLGPGLVHGVLGPWSWAVRPCAELDRPPRLIPRTVDEGQRTERL